jgi:glycosyltransferase involved in cell wall biosynthesis
MCFPLPTDNVGISYTSLSIYKEMRKQGFPVSFLTPVIRRNAFGLGIRQVVPFCFRFLPWKYLRKLSDFYYPREILKAADNNTIFDLWSDHRPALIEQIKQRGGLVVKEKFNSAQEVAKTLLVEEYKRSSLPDRCAITTESIRSENQQLAAADYVFSPSPMVLETLLQVGIAREKIIPTSFGWDEASLTNQNPLLAGSYKKPRFLYVGSVEIRKGAHLLLKYWIEAGIDGTLFFLGTVREEMKTVLNELKLPENVVFLGHHEKAHGIYNEIDVFVFPSLEEGGPLVTYEAMARGVPVIVSPMGAGAVARASIDGFVVEPHDRGGWVAALKAMGTNVELRHDMAVSAKERATLFTWSRVATQRYHDLIEKIRN